MTFFSKLFHHFIQNLISFGNIHTFVDLFWYTLIFLTVVREFMEEYKEGILNK